MGLVGIDPLPSVLGPVYYYSAIILPKKPDYGLFFILRDFNIRGEYFYFKLLRVNYWTL